jgi:hypothetical protein
MVDCWLQPLTSAKRLSDAEIEKSFPINLNPHTLEEVELNNEAINKRKGAKWYRDFYESSPLPDVTDHVRDDEFGPVDLTNVEPDRLIPNRDKQIIAKQDELLVVYRKLSVPNDYRDRINRLESDLSALRTEGEKG